MNIEVTKTNKLFIGGQFPRSESGRSELLTTQGSKTPTYLCLASRKDLRMAVEAAHKGLISWQNKTAYNRGQILYRMAEMVSSRRGELEQNLKSLFGLSDKEASSQVDEALETLVYYAGFSDKLTQLLGTVNPVSGPLNNFSTLEAMGVVGVIESQGPFDFSQCIHRLSALICAGNAVVAILPQPSGGLIPFLGEVFQNSDLPAGVINLLSGTVDELAPVLAGHRELQSLVVSPGYDSSQWQSLSVDNMKRFIPWRWPNKGLAPLSECVEVKTLWHPKGQ